METPDLPERLVTRESPRQILAEDFPKIGELPIRGGWGYTKHDAVIIDANDPIVPRDVPFDGVRIEYLFAEKRIFEEWIIFRPPGFKFSEIRSQRLEQHLIQDGQRRFDRLVFEVSAFRDADWAMLNESLQGPEGFRSASFNIEAHKRLRDSKRVTRREDFWFDITSFFG